MMLLIYFLSHNVLKLKLCAGPNVNVVDCTNYRDSSPQDLYIVHPMTLVLGHYINNFLPSNC